MDIAIFKRKCEILHEENFGQNQEHLLRLQCRCEIDGPLAHAAIPFIVPSSTDFLYLYL